MATLSAGGAAVAQAPAATWQQHSRQQPRHAAAASVAKGAAVNVATWRPTEKRLPARAKAAPRGATWAHRARHAAPCRALLTGESPAWNDDDYIVLGLAHCFVKDEDAKLQDIFVVEAVPAGAVECMDNGGVTCYKHTTATTLGVALKQDVSLLPSEFHGSKFADDFDFRCKCASRTWKRDHPQEHLLNLVPKDGVRSDWNFSLEDKRILNMEHEVSDSDNIKQDLSIDVYGRKGEGDGDGKEVALAGADADIQKLYNA